MEHSKAVENESFDSIIVIGQNLEDDLKKNNLQNQLKDLEIVKKVNSILRKFFFQ